MRLRHTAHEDARAASSSPLSGPRTCSALTVNLLSLRSLHSSGSWPLSLLRSCSAELCPLRRLLRGHPSLLRSCSAELPVEKTAQGPSRSRHCVLFSMVLPGKQPWQRYRLTNVFGPWHSTLFESTLYLSTKNRSPPGLVVPLSGILASRRRKQRKNGEKTSKNGRDTA